MSSDDFLYASIHEVIKTLLEAIFLVILVVYVFLQDLRSTLIPLVGIVVSLVGTFAFMSVAGFSLNLITLFALVLVIGTVVDDAIVVVEAVQARFDVGYKSSYMASIDAMKGISNAVITSSLVFMAVFIPVSFMSGTSGTFYTQFGLTMAVAVGISAINALTLSPALCAILLPTMLVAILFVVTAISGDGKRELKVEIAEAQQEEEKLEEVETPPDTEPPPDTDQFFPFKSDLFHAEHP